jgi:hypothetical protein
MIQSSASIICTSKAPEIPVTVENCESGRSVRRGRDWKWADQDHQHGFPGTGVIDYCTTGGYGAVVDWNNGNTLGYRIGQDNYFDLYYAGNNKQHN